MQNKVRVKLRNIGSVMLDGTAGKGNQNYIKIIPAIPKIEDLFNHSEILEGVESEEPETNSVAYLAAQ